jgi:hypothetical protein
VDRGDRRRRLQPDYTVAHETFADVAGYLVPELQRRDVFKRDYAPGTLREKLFGAGARLGEDHPAALYRNLALTASDARALAPST